MIIANKTVTQAMIKDWERTSSSLLALPEDINPELLEQIKSYYELNKMDLEAPLKNMENLTNLFSDWIWNYGFHSGMKEHIKWLDNSENPLFIYYYSYQGVFGLDQIIRYIKGDYWHPLIDVVVGTVTDWIRVNLLGESMPKYGKVL